MRTFSERMWRAIAFIESGAEHTRQLDEAFENNDGDAMAAALIVMARKRPVLAANLASYVSVDSASKSERVAPLLNKSIADIRRAAAVQRGEVPAGPLFFQAS